MVKYSGYQLKRVDQCANYMPKEFDIYLPGKSFVEKAATFAWFPIEF